ncbi:MAG: phosphotransferase [Bacteroidota bacterium]
MPSTLPTLDLDPQAKLSDLISDEDFKFRLAQVVASYLPDCRWFTSKGKIIQGVVIEHAFGLTDQTALLILGVSFSDGTKEMYQFPLAWNWEPEWLADLQDFNTHLALAQIGEPAEVILSDAINRASFRRALFQVLAGDFSPDSTLISDRGTLLKDVDRDEITSVVPAFDTSNTAIIYQDRLFFKLFRKLDVGLNPDLELVRFLSEQTTFEHSPAYAGSLSVRDSKSSESINLGICIGKVENQGDAWSLFQNLTEGFYQRVLELKPASFLKIPVHNSFHQLDSSHQELIGRETADRVTLLARRTAEMHLALASATPDQPELVMEPLTTEYTIEISRAASQLFDRQIRELRDRIGELKSEQRVMANKILKLEQEIRTRLTSLENRSIDGQIIRIHGDYHLGQVLYDETDYCIIDFEGEPLLTIPQRRRKRPPYKDVAGMIRSLHYAVSGQLLLNIRYRPAPAGLASAGGEVQKLKPWGNWWFSCLRSTFLEEYHRVLGPHQLLPNNGEDREILLDLFVLEKAVYEVAYELNSRPDWLDIPLQGLLFALEDGQ